MNDRKQSILKYECKTCGKTDKDVEFYSYLPSRCKTCKRKDTRERKDEHKDEEIQKKYEQLDPNAKIRTVVEDLVKNEKIFNNTYSIYEMLIENDSEISSLSVSSNAKINNLYSMMIQLKSDIQKINENIEYIMTKLN